VDQDPREISRIFFNRGCSYWKDTATAPSAVVLRQLYLAVPDCGGTEIQEEAIIIKAVSLHFHESSSRQSPLISMEAVLGRPLGSKIRWHCCWPSPKEKLTVSKDENPIDAAPFRMSW
jgi:hypothetical protein